MDLGFSHIFVLYWLTFALRWIYKQRDDLWKTSTISLT